MNVFLHGDVYQLPPVGNVAFMGNPRSEAVLGSSAVRSMIERIWSCCDDDSIDNIQCWREEGCATMTKVLDLDVNHRSGEDVWYSSVIDSCRRGEMHLDNWRFLHGAPTTC